MTAGTCVHGVVGMPMKGARDACVRVLEGGSQCPGLCMVAGDMTVRGGKRPFNVFIHSACASM